MIDGVEPISFQVHGDDRGSLVAIESGKNIEFEMKRIYYIYNTDYNIVRGKHAHRDLKQILICLHGQCDILLDNGKEKEVVKLNAPDKGIYIKGFVWREMMHFSNDCVLLALVNRPYDPDDYVYDRTALQQ